MKNREQLHRFIKKLSKSEKRAFKLYMSKYETAKDKKIIKLFDAINKMDEFDESKLYKITTKKILNYDLHRLRQRLLNALSDLHFKKDGNSLGEIINRIELGFKYETPEIIEEELVKGYKLAAEKGNDYIYQIIADFEYRLSFVRKDLNRIIETTKNKLRTNKRIEEDNLYDLMGREMHLWYTQNYKKETLEPLVFSSPELEAKFNGPTEDKANLKQSKAFYKAHSMVAYLQKDFAKHLKIEEAIFNLLINSDSDPQIKNTICFSLDNLIVIYLTNNRISEAENTLSVFGKKYLENKNIPGFNIIELSYYRSLVRILLVKGEYNEIISLLPNYEKYLEPKTNKSFLYLADYNIREFKIFVILSYFYLKKYDKCLDWIALDERGIGNKGIEQELQVKFIQVLCYYELGSERLVDSLKNNIYYLINKKGDKSSNNVKYYEVLQAILKGKNVTEDWAKAKVDKSIFSIGNIIDKYLELNQAKE